MFSDFLKRVPEIVEKNLFLCMVGTLILGGAIVFFVFEKQLDKSYTLEVSSEQREINESLDDDSKNAKIFVDLSGAVNKPGIYELPQGSRVGELLGLGEGASNDASAKWISKNLNLSKKLVDASKVYIPFEWEVYTPESYEISKTINILSDGLGEESGDESNNSSSGNSQNPDSYSYTDVSNNDSDSESGSSSSDTSAGSNSGKINVNKASSSELDTLPGIGPAFAEKIISNRPYKDYSEFESKSGVYKSTAESIKDLISF